MTRSAARGHRLSGRRVRTHAQICRKTRAPTPRCARRALARPQCADGATLSNDNGALICSSGSARLPGGSWINSCGPIGFEKNVLTAYCGLTYSNGTQKLSVLNMTSCTNTGVTSTVSWERFPPTQASVCAALVRGAR